MRRALLLGLTAAVAIALCAGCKKVYMVPTRQGWYEMQMKHRGDEIKMKPAEKMEVEYEY